MPEKKPFKDITLDEEEEILDKVWEKLRKNEAALNDDARLYNLLALMN